MTLNIAIIAQIVKNVLIVIDVIVALDVLIVMIVLNAKIAKWLVDAIYAPSVNIATTHVMKRNKNL